MLELSLPSGYLTLRHGKSPFFIGKPSINGPFSMATLNNQMVSIFGAQKLSIIFGMYWLLAYSRALMGKKNVRNHGPPHSVTARPSP